MQALHEHLGKDGFRLRGVEMSRLDTFSDVVFGFALTLIVVSLEVPRTYDELHKVLVGFIPFTICFLFLISIWWAHLRFFRMFGLHDFPTVVINSILLFTVLFYVYPLKFLSVLVVGQMSGHVTSNIFSAPLQARELMMVYGAGFAAIYFCMMGLYWNAWRQRVHLRLNPLERTLTLSLLWNYVLLALVGLICCVFARILSPENAGTAGYTFFLISISKTVHGFISARYVRAAQARTTPDERHALPQNL